MRWRHCGDAIQLSDPQLGHDLVAYLRRCDCRAEELRAGLVEVEPSPRQGDRALARLELDFYLRAASAMPGGPCVDALNIRRLPLRGEATSSTHFER